MLDIDEALQTVVSLAGTLPSESVELGSAIRRTLAEDVCAPDDVPAFDASVMDGYAVDSASFRGAGPWSFKVNHESRAGHLPPSHEVGTSMRIFTGAPLPIGADCVVMQEEVELKGGHVQFQRAPKQGLFVRKRGSEVSRGQKILCRGTPLGAGHLGILAMLNRNTALVSRKARVRILPTGDELRVPGSTIAAGTIPECNGPLIAGIAEHAGADVTIACPVPDDIEKLTRAFEEALLSSDLVITIGGVSVGDHDRVPAVLEACGVKLAFHKVSMKPGKPLLVGSRNGTVVLGLPGNPMSALITFAIFGVPLLHSIHGRTQVVPARTRAKLAQDFAHSPGRTEFARGILSADGATVTPSVLQQSSALAALVEADCLFLVPKSEGDLSAGSVVDVIRLSPFGVV